MSTGANGPIGREGLRVAICGAGIGGLITALTLSKFPNIHVDLYERASELTEVGAGIGIWPRPWDVIRKLGIDNDLLATTDSRPHNGPSRAISYRKADEAHGYDFYSLQTQGSLVTLHRQDFQNVLLASLPSTYRIYANKRLKSYSQSPPLPPSSSHPLHVQHAIHPIQLNFSDGAKSSCDILIGADGLNSSVRKSLLQELASLVPPQSGKREAILSCAQPLWTGSIMYRALISAHELRKTGGANHRALTSFMQYVGTNAYVLAYPISKGQMINFVAYSTDPSSENTPYPSDCRPVESVDPSFLQELFKGWEDEVKHLCLCLTTTKTQKWAIQTVKPLGSYVSGCVALVGDAAHAMTPHQGAGAGQAIEDAYILGSLVGHVTTQQRSSHSSLQRNLHNALKVYDQIRRPKSQEVAKKSRMNGMCFSLCDERGSVLRLPSSSQLNGRRSSAMNGHGRGELANGHTNANDHHPQFRSASLSHRPSEHPASLHSQSSYVRGESDCLRSDDKKFLYGVMETARKGWEWSWNIERGHRVEDDLSEGLRRLATEMNMR